MGSPSIRPVEDAGAEPPADAGNGILGQVGGEWVAKGAKQLPPAGPELGDQPLRTVELEVGGLGVVRVTYELSSYRFRRSHQWHWRARRADLVGPAPKPAGLRIIITGGREFADRNFVFETLDRVHAKRGIGTLLLGGARGADTLAGAWAAERGVPVEVFVARWKDLGPRAGPVRNQEMVDAGGDGGVCFPGGKGTADCARRMEAAGIKVWYPWEKPEGVP